MVHSVILIQCVSFLLDMQLHRYLLGASLTADVLNIIDYLLCYVYIPLRLSVVKSIIKKERKKCIEMEYTRIKFR